MYEAVTRGIRIRVTPQYLEEQSSPERADISGPTPSTSSTRASETVQLRSRHWRITDAHGHTEEVRGPGVVGETPVLAARQLVPLHLGLPAARRRPGIMVGSYQMTTRAGEMFDVAIPAFSLDSPHAKRSVN